MRDPALYLDASGPVDLLETHISYVLLAGSHAYKIKKAVNLGFLDFSTLARRHEFCEEELRLNSRLAPDLYQAVVAITGSPVAPRLNGPGEAIEYAVQMQRFPQDALLDRQLSEGRLDAAAIDQLADTLADFHGRIARAPPDNPFGTPQAVWAPMAQNFDQLRTLLPDPGHASHLDQLETWSRQRFSQLNRLLVSRSRAGWIRECHGDLHLGNIARVDRELHIFDCIEFSHELRWIDVFSEIAFLVMDLEERGRPDYGQRFLNRYLEATGDYRGLPLLDFYKVYRALVRAKICAIRDQQHPSSGPGPQLADGERYLAYAAQAIQPRQPCLLLMHGVAGSGKTWLAGQLLEELGALRIRSDVERKRLRGLTPAARSHSGLGSGIYDPATTTATYGQLLELANDILAADYPVVVDAANLQAWQRTAFRQLAATWRVPFVILACTAPSAALLARIAERQATSGEASEADQAVLAHQMQTREALSPEEEACCLHIDTAAPLPADLHRRLRAIATTGGPHPMENRS
ncbi:MAG TPA: AAA family ATPase [Azonexus sp.]|nr:AAA family ATPase [Azonexus sp.]